MIVIGPLDKTNEVASSISRTVLLGILEVLRQLNGGLGATRVAALTGCNDPRISYERAREKRFRSKMKRSAEIAAGPPGMDRRVHQ